MQTNVAGSRHVPHVIVNTVVPHATKPNASHPTPVTADHGVSEKSFLADTNISLVIWSMHRQQQKQKVAMLAGLSQVTVCEEHIAIHGVSMVGMGIFND